MDSTYEDRTRYWDASARVKEAMYRHVLADLLSRVFDVTAIPGGTRPSIDKLDEEEFEHVVRRLQETVVEVERAWEPAMKLNPAGSAAGPLPADARAQIRMAFTTLRAAATRLVAGPPAVFARPLRLTIGFSLSDQGPERRARWRLEARLDDALVWMGLRLLTEVDRSLIRRCTFAGCSRVYVALKNQRYCAHHQETARRQTQRRALQAFRARSKKSKTTTATTRRKP
jgi:hypothetical protein